MLTLIFQIQKQTLGSVSAKPCAEPAGWLGGKAPCRQADNLNLIPGTNTRKTYSHYMGAHTCVYTHTLAHLKLQLLKNFVVSFMASSHRIYQDYLPLGSIKEIN